MEIVIQAIYLTLIVVLTAAVIWQRLRAGFWKRAYLAAEAQRKPLDDGHIVYYDHIDADGTVQHFAVRDFWPDEITEI